VGEADVVVQLRKPDGNGADSTHRVLTTEGRLGPETTHTVQLTGIGYVMVGEGRIGQAGLLHASLIGILPRTEGAAIGVAALVEELGSRTNESTLRDVLKGMEAVGLVSRVGTGKRGNALRYWLSNPPPADSEIDSTVYRNSVPCNQSQGDQVTPSESHSGGRQPLVSVVRNSFNGTVSPIPSNQFPIEEQEVFDGRF